MFNAREGEPMMYSTRLPGKVPVIRIYSGLVEESLFHANGEGLKHSINHNVDHRTQCIFTQLTSVIKRNKSLTLPSSSEEVADAITELNCLDLKQIGLFQEGTVIIHLTSRLSNYRELISLHYDQGMPEDYSRLINRGMVKYELSAKGWETVHHFHPQADWRKPLANRIYNQPQGLAGALICEGIYICPDSFDRYIEQAQVQLGYIKP